MYINGNTITVSTVIHIYGPGASEAKAKEIQGAIMSKWQGGEFVGKDGKIYNIKFDVKVVNHTETSILKFKNDIKTGDNVAFIEDDPEGKVRSEVRNGYYGVWSSKRHAAAHELGHMFGLADKYFDYAYQKTDKDCKNDCGYEIRAVNLEGVLPEDLMGANEGAEFSMVAKTELTAIGNYILSLEANKGVLRAKKLSLDLPTSLPPPPPIDISPEQLEELAGYGTRVHAPGVIKN